MANDALHGPHLVAAFLCEKVLQEKDGVLSFVRVVDRFTAAGITPTMQTLQIQAMLVVAFKAGTIGSGKYKVTVTVHKPDGSQIAEVHTSFFFEGGEDQGVTNVNQVILAVNEEGLYWLDVMFEGALKTRIPMRVLYQQMMPSMPQPPEGR